MGEPAERRRRQLEALCPNEPRGRDGGDETSTGSNHTPRPGQRQDPAVQPMRLQGPSGCIRLTFVCHWTAVPALWLFSQALIGDEFSDTRKPPKGSAHLNQIGGTVMQMASKRVKKAGSGAVLPKAKSTAGGKSIRSVDDLLSGKQRKDLRSDLHEMAQLRRDAEASSGALRLS